MSSGDEEYDQRFRDLIRAEFGDVAGVRAPGQEPDPEPEAPQPRPRRFGARKLPDPIEYFNLEQEIAHATPDPDDIERWTPDDPAPLGRPPIRVMVGILLVVAAMLVGVMVLAGSRPGWVVGIATVVVGGVGLALLLSALPKSGPDLGNGAQV